MFTSSQLLPGVWATCPLPFGQLLGLVVQVPVPDPSVLTQLQAHSGMREVKIQN